MPRARANQCCPKKDTKRTQKGQKKDTNFYYPGELQIKQKWTETLACVSYTLYNTKDCLRCPGQGENQCCSKKDMERTQKGHKKDTHFYIALDGFNSSRNELKYCLVCNICSIHKRIAPHAQGKGKSMLPPKGHKKDAKRTKKIIALEGFKSGRNRLKHWPLCHIRSIIQRIAFNAQGKVKINVAPKRTQKGHKKDTNFYIALDVFNSSRNELKY